MAPRPTPCRGCWRALGLKLQDFDFYEIHEAFAAQVLCTLDRLGQDAAFCRDKLGLDKPLGAIDMAKLNVNGSSLAAGHPFAGHRRAHRRHAGQDAGAKGSGRGLISICAAGGQGVVAIIER